MQQALDQASAAIDAAVQSYAGEIANMKQEIAAKQAMMEQEMAAQKAELAAMGTALTQHQDRYSAITALRTAPQPVPVDVVGEAPQPPVSLSPGSAPVAGANSDGLAASVARVMQGMPPAVPYPTTPAGA